MAVIRAALEQADCRPSGGDRRFRAICPSCGARSATKLLVSEGNTAIGITCFAGCEWHEVLSSLGLPHTVAFLGSGEFRLWRATSVELKDYALGVLGTTDKWKDAVAAGRRPPPFHGSLLLVARLIREQAVDGGSAGGAAESLVRVPQRPKLDGFLHEFTRLVVLADYRDKVALWRLEGAIEDARRSVRALWGRRGFASRTPDFYVRVLARELAAEAKRRGLRYRRD